MNVDDIKRRNKDKRNNYVLNSNKKGEEVVKQKKVIYSFLFKVCVAFLFFLVIGIVIKQKPSYKDYIYNKLYNESFTFASINKFYNEKFGDILPVYNIFKNDSKEKVSGEFTYSKKEEYLNGSKYTVDSEYLMPALESGLIIFIGDKDDLKNCVIIQGIDGYDYWYSQIEKPDFKLYDYVEKGSLLGLVTKSIYVAKQKNGEFVLFDELDI